MKHKKKHISGTIKKGRWDGLPGGLPGGLEWDTARWGRKLEEHPQQATLDAGASSYNPS